MSCLPEIQAAVAELVEWTLYAGIVSGGFVAWSIAMWVAVNKRMDDIGSFEAHRNLPPRGES